MKWWCASVLVMAVVACERHVEPPAPVAPVTAGGKAQQQQQDPWAAQTALADPLKRPLLWAIEKDGKTTYAFGTMHMGVDPERRIPKLVWDKLDGAKTFAMETDLSQAQKLDVMRHDGKSLREELGEAYWKKLEAAIGEGAAARMTGMKPMLPATLLSTRGLPETPAMDSVLFGRASNEHKQLVFLEPLEREAVVLDKWMDARALEEMLDDLPGAEQHSREMLAAYVAGDPDEIVALTEAERGDFKKMGRTDAEFDQQMDDLLYSRNASWIEAIEKLHAEGGGFIAVGAMHLCGKRSVLDLLRQKGYKVTRLTPGT